MKLGILGNPIILESDTSLVRTLGEARAQHATRREISTFVHEDKFLGLGVVNHADKKVLRVLDYYSQSAWSYTPPSPISYELTLFDISAASRTRASRGWNWVYGMGIENDDN